MSKLQEAKGCLNLGLNGAILAGGGIIAANLDYEKLASSSVGILMLIASMEYFLNTQFRKPMKSFETGESRHILGAIASLTLIGALAALIANDGMVTKELLMAAGAYATMRGMMKFVD